MLADQFKAQTYELAAAAGPPAYFGYVGYEHNGRLFSPAVTVNDLRSEERRVGKECRL